MYTDGKCGFPHEMGLILGYPIEDVIGFIENEGKNYLCNGYWKVYHNAPAKQRVFDNYKKATETIIKLVSSGVSVRKCIDISLLYTVN